MDHWIELGRVWFTGREQIGIALIEDVITGEAKAYIRPTLGINEEDDFISIMEYGTKFPVKEAISIIRSRGQFGYITKEEFDEKVNRLRAAW